MYMLCVMGVPSRNVQKREPPPWGTACAAPYLLDLQGFHLHRPAILQPDDPVAASEGGGPVRDEQQQFVPALLPKGAQQQPERREFPDAAIPHDAHLLPARDRQTKVLYDCPGYVPAEGVRGKPLPYYS